ncbi:diguanylate cyclase [Sulfurimonas sp.]|uniref:diguanylate cyclase n=1 Tax=Sulfurimonas sp. TaxID=2022749 RepID=UPI0035619B7C
MGNKLKIIERQNVTLQRLNEIASISNMSPKETLREALAIGKEHFGLEFGIVSHIVGEDYTVDVQSSPPDTLHDEQLFALGSTYCKTTLELNDILAIKDVTTSKYVGHPCHRDFDLVSYIGAPVRVNSKIYGTINFSSPKARQLEYDSTDDEFMRLLARWAGSFMERQIALDELSLAKKRFEMIFENNASGIMLVDESCQIVMVNKRLCDIVGFSKEELIGQNSRTFHIASTTYETMTDNFAKIKNDSYEKIEYQLKRKDSRQIWCEFFGSSIELTKNTQGVIWSILDITTQKELQNRLEAQATTDYLTELYNRRHFAERLEEELSRIKRNKNATASLMMFDLDRFKQINDTLGHLAGDEVLKKFADILRDNSRKTDIAGRIGGEEFALILPNTEIQNALILANKIKDEVSNQSIVIDGISVNVTVSIGLTDLTFDDMNCDSAFARADNALYRAKENGRNRVEL